MEKKAEQISFELVSEFIKKRDIFSHKGSFGRALLICGSYGMAGAAVLSARAALRCGVGICECLTDQKIYPIIAPAVPEAVFTPVGASERLSAILRRTKKSDAVLIGCGLGLSKETREDVFTLIENSDRPICIDADGINAVSSHIDVLGKHGCDIVLTPHPGEMARLLNVSVEEIQQNRQAAAQEFAAHTDTIVVLKGHETVVASPSGGLFINTTGNPGMATGGSGDVLAGMVVSLMAQGIPALYAALSAVYIHGRAGDKAAQRLSEHSMLPSDIISELPSVFLEFENRLGEAHEA